MKPRAVSSLVLATFLNFAVPAGAQDAGVEEPPLDEKEKPPLEEEQKPERPPPTTGALPVDDFDSIWSRLTSFVFIFATVLLLYTIVPYERSPWRELLPGALVAALLFELLKALFVLYLDNARNLETVYGSLSSIVVLLLWLYFSARVLLFGVEIIAVRKEPSTHELV